MLKVNIQSHDYGGKTKCFMRVPEGYVVTDEFARVVPRVVGDIELLRPRRYIIHFDVWLGGGYVICGKIKMIRMLARHWRYYGNDKINML